MPNREDTLLELLEKQSKILEQLVSGKDNGQADKAIAGNSTYTPLHGPGGIFSGPGLEQDIITAHVRPYGLASQLPLLPTVYTNPLFGLITGYTDVSGDEPEKACEDAPAGYMKSGHLTAKFGLLRRDSQEIDIDDVMLKLHRGDFTDLVLRGRVLGLTNLHPGSINDSNDILNIVSASEMVNMGVQVERVMSRALWQSTVANGHIGPGLDVQIATGQIDALTGAAIPSVDSDVKNFGYDNVGGGGRDIVEYLSSMEWYLRNNAMTMGLDPVNWVVVMRPELWFELSAIWPCSYLSHRCGTADGSNPIVINDNVNVSLRDQMRNGMFIDINGNRYPVVVDVGIFEHNNVNNGNLGLGEYASTIYFLPLTIGGGFPVTYREHVDYRQAARDLALTQGHLPSWSTDNGVFNWALSYEKYCYKFHLKTEQRVILRTPHLAGRLDAVKYSPLQHLRDAHPDSPYFRDGGVSLLANDPGFQAVWL
jgi:hypothetical protein